MPRLPVRPIHLLLLLLLLVLGARAAAAPRALYAAFKPPRPPACPVQSGLSGSSSKSANESAQLRFEELREFLRERGGYVHPWLAARVFPGTGAGLTVLGRVPPQRTLVEVPMEALLTSDRVLDEVPEWEALDVGQETLIALYIARERWLSENDPLYEGGPFAVYVRHLPRTCGNVLGWSAAAHRAVMGTQAESSATLQQMRVVAEFQRLMGSGRARFDFELSGSLFYWAQCMVMSRSFSLSDHSSCAELADMALVPLCDLFNHRSAGATINYGFQADEGAFVMASSEDAALEPGREVFESYGRLPNRALLVNYGFVEEAANPHDDLRWTVRLTPQQERLSAPVPRVLREALGLGDVSVDAHGHASKASLAYLRVLLHANLSSFDVANAVRRNQPLGERTEAAVYEFLRSTCASQLRSAPKAQPKWRAAAAAGDTALAAVLRLRACEEQALRRCVETYKEPVLLRRGEGGGRRRREKEN